MEDKISLTGIKPTGVPHIGNYLGAIKPALALADKYKTYYFIADYHALNIIKEKARMKDLVYQVAAAWLACGLDPEKTVFYRQSDIPQTFEIFTFLTCFTAKGLLNRAHAYKACLDKNRAAGRDPDDGVNAGLFTYPVLMAADILQFQADYIPVGKDQFQHVEMAADIAQTINFNFGKELLKVPQPLAQEQTQMVLGLDGRKMSKSYDNVIPLFQPENELKKLIMRIVTNSQSVDEPKNPDESSIFSIYSLFAQPDEIAALRARFLAGGLGWGDAKGILFQQLNSVLAPMREKYFHYYNNPKLIDEILAQGAEKARREVNRTLGKLRKAIGFDR